MIKEPMTFPGNHNLNALILTLSLQKKNAAINVPIANLLHKLQKQQHLDYYAWAHQREIVATPNNPLQYWILNIGSESFTLLSLVLHSCWTSVWYSPEIVPWYPIGRFKILPLVDRDFWWPHLKMKLGNMFLHALFAAYSRHSGQLVGEHLPLPTPERPW